MKPLSSYDGAGLLIHDSWLHPYKQVLLRRHGELLAKQRALIEKDGSLFQACQQYKYLGMHRGKNKGRSGWWYREWAPNALQLYLIGDFNDWNRLSHPMKKNDQGVWELFIADQQDRPVIGYQSAYKVHIVTKKEALDRLPAMAQHIVGINNNADFQAITPPKQEYEFKYSAPPVPDNPKIYEAHIGMAQEAPKIGSYKEFTKNILPRVKKAGYNVVQLMAIAQHPYYGSFGYQVGSFFAPSNYFGPPEDLAKLVDTAHKLGLHVIIDLVHSHAVRNKLEGLDLFDGSDNQYFYPGNRGSHPAWDTKLFDYGKLEVLEFLLSNISYWIESYQIDGFRFDGVTSMLYTHHGLEKTFNHYDMYFNQDVDDNAVVYLKLANMIIHHYGNKLSIAEDMSGMPGIARPVHEGGLGFDYRLAMGVPDYWIASIKHESDETRHLGKMFHTLTDTRYNEKHIGYAESHDQSLVGDKTMAFRLMDAQMYTSMSKMIDDPIIDRGIALHKMIKLITFTLAGDGWLNFIGNEFGHPEWVDFPRPGNNFSHHHARRQWSLVDNKNLKYHYLGDFDAALMQTDEQYGLLTKQNKHLIKVDEDAKKLIYAIGDIIVVHNLHPSKSYQNVEIPIPVESDYKLVLSTDDARYGGFDRVKTGFIYPWTKPQTGSQIITYLPCRSSQLLVPIKNYPTT